MRPSALLLLLLLTPWAVHCFDNAFDDEETSLDSASVQGNLTGVPVGRTFLLLHLLKEKLHKLHGLEKIPTYPPVPVGCICVAFYLCGPNGTIATDIPGLIDVRTYRRCTGDFEVCCYLRIVVPTAPPPVTLPTTVPTTPSTIPTTPSTIPTTPPTTPTTPTTMSTTPSTIPTTPSTIPTMPSTTSSTTTTPRPTTPSTIPTTPSTTPTTTTTTARPVPVPYVYCYCVPIYTCPIAGGGSVPSTGVIDPRLQLASTCTGAYVCCSYYTGTAPAAFPQYTLPQQQQTIVVPQQPVVIPQQPVVIPQQPVVIPQQPVVLPPIVYGQSCVCLLLAQCSLGYMPITGLVNLDPRLVLARQGQPPGSCSAGSMCCRIQNTGSPAQVVSQQLPLPVSANVPAPIPVVQANIGASPASPAVDIKNKGTADACICILMEQCADGQAVTYDGIGAIDPRFGPCMSATLVCCRLQGKQRSNIVIAEPSNNSPVYALPALRLGQQTLALCGQRDATYAKSPAPGPGNAYFAEFPWMALLLIRRPGSPDVLQCGGSLISSRVVLTAAHCVVGNDPSSLMVRLGEWDTRNANEPLVHQELAVQSIIVHPLYTSFPNTLYNDVALVLLATPATYAVNVRPICLPAYGQSYTEGTVCYATGWGRSSFGPNGEYQAILRKIDLPIVGNANCQSRLRQTRLGPLFQLHPSFMCAGGEENKDTCYKDGGGPLVCSDPTTGRFIQVGIVSWGIGCGDRTPAVYASVAQAQPWIAQQLTLYAVNT